MFQKIQWYFEYCNSGLLPILCVVYHFRTLFWITVLSFRLPQAEGLSPSCNVKMIMHLEITGVVLTSYMVHACHCQLLFSYKPVPGNEPSVPRVRFSFTHLLWNAIISLLSSATLGREHLHMHIPLISEWVVLHLPPPGRPAGVQLETWGCWPSLPTFISIFSPSVWWVSGYSGMSVTGHVERGIKSALGKIAIDLACRGDKKNKTVVRSWREIFCSQQC